MQAEFHAANDAGEPLSFALGCLVGAWREMPVHEEGRFALASHVLAVGVVVPMAALLLLSVALGSPYLNLDEIGAGSLLGTGKPIFPVTAANRAGLPLLAILTFVLGLGHLCMGWAMLDRDWTRVAALGRIGASVIMTMVTFTGILFLCDSCALPQAATIAIELAAIWSLARWHSELPCCDVGGATS